MATLQSATITPMIVKQKCVCRLPRSGRTSLVGSSHALDEPHRQRIVAIGVAIPLVVTFNGWRSLFFDSPGFSPSLSVLGHGLSTPR